MPVPQQPGELGTLLASRHARERVSKRRPRAQRRTLDGSRAFWWFLKFVLPGLPLRLLFRPKATGLEHIPPTGGAIIAANHVSFLDPLVLPLVIPSRRVMFLTKVKYIDKLALRWILAGAACRRVERRGRCR